MYCELLSVRLPITILCINVYLHLFLSYSRLSLWTHFLCFSLSLFLQREGQLKFVSSSSRQLGATHNEQIEIDSTMLYLLSKSLICNKTVHKRIILPKNGRIQTLNRMHCNKEWDLSALACVLNCCKKAKDLTAAIICQETTLLGFSLDYHPPPPGFSDIYLGTVKFKNYFCFGYPHSRKHDGHFGWGISGVSNFSSLDITGANPKCPPIHPMNLSLKIS